MLSTFVIALREGLEAALIVGILVAYIVRTDRRQLLKPLWIGVVTAIAASLGLGAILSFTSAELTPRGEELFAGLTSFIAVGLVTWMVFWMKRAARTLRDELHGKVDNSLVGGPLSLALVAFFAVVREGLETALFIYTNFKTVGAASSATVGLVLGLAVAIALGYLLYNRSVKINLSKFFTITGVALIIVAAGVLSYGIHEFQELGFLPGADTFIWDVTPWIAKESILGSVLGGTFGFDTTTSYLQFFAWTGYLVAVLVPYLSKKSKTKAPALRVPATV
ncbi:FTR1 High-affinity Fe2+/Pb2+ permease [Candidatus Nanopelagicaceae bacterium]